MKRSSAIDYPIGFRREPITLMGALPKGSRWHMWEYIRVFGVTQWSIFLILLIILGIVIATTNKLRTDVRISFFPL